MIDAWFYLLDFIKEHLAYIMACVCFLVLMILDDGEGEES